MECSECNKDLIGMPIVEKLEVTINYLDTSIEIVTHEPICLECAKKALLSVNQEMQ